MSDLFKKRPSELLYDEIKTLIGDQYPHVMDELKDIIEEKD
tara:strand:+ start:3558 stop:3680 length:123 start_codon:yes stop_codon:yes gene_type:complete